jgi:hypothetical protein
MSADAARPGPGLDLYWIPLGADTVVVRFSGSVYEGLVAALQRRDRFDLYHAALVARLDGPPITVEVAPVPDDEGRTRRGVVADGAVGSRLLGRWRLFRYEVRRWPGGEIPDLPHAVASPVTITAEPALVTAALGQLELVPTPVWGRDELHLGDMWNSNSVVSWVLSTTGLLAPGLGPPPGGRAPGWDAGARLAQRATRSLP